MVSALINAGLVAVYCGAVVWAMLLIRTRNDESGPSLSTRGFLFIYFSSLVLLLKFWQFEDAVLLVGQILTTFLLSIYGLLLLGQALIPQKGIGPEPASPEVPQPLPATGRHLPKRWKAAILVAVLLLAAAGWLVKLFSASPVGTVGKPLYPVSSSSAPQQITFTGKRFSFDYPSSYISSPTATPKAPILESYVLVKRSTISWQLAIQIESLPSGNFSDSGGYHFRQVHPERFSETRVTYTGKNVRVMTDKEAAGSFAKNAFFVHGGLLASVSLTGGSSSDAEAMQADFDAIISSWKWL
jgi:hypothetical protein